MKTILLILQLLIFANCNAQIYNRIYDSDYSVYKDDYIVVNDKASINTQQPDTLIVRFRSLQTAMQFIIVCRYIEDGDICYKLLTHDGTKALLARKYCINGRKIMLFEFDRNTKFYLERIIIAIKKS